MAEQATAPKTAILLAGHGSRLTPDSANAVRAVADRLRAFEVVDQVASGFWIEPPSFVETLDQLKSEGVEDVTVIPFFTARGYFTQQVIPTALRIESMITVRGQMTIRYAPTLSETPFLDDAARQFATDAQRAQQIDPVTCAIAIIGHGTERNPQSRDAAERCADLLRREGCAAEVVALFLDDAPPIREVWARTVARNVIAVPYFMVSGSHVQFDIRRELELLQPPDRALHITAPVGEHPHLPTMLIRLAAEAGAPLRVRV